MDNSSNPAAAVDSVDLEQVQAAELARWAADRPAEFSAERCIQAIQALPRDGQIVIATTVTTEDQLVDLRRLLDGSREVARILREINASLEERVDRLEAENAALRKAMGAVPMPNDVKVARRRMSGPEAAAFLRAQRRAAKS